MVVAAGIDVSKANMDVSVSECPLRRFENSATDIRRLFGIWTGYAWPGRCASPPADVNASWVGKLREKAINVQAVHPNGVRAFARTCGYEG